MLVLNKKPCEMYIKYQQHLPIYIYLKRQNGIPIINAFEINNLNTDIKPRNKYYFNEFIAAKHFLIVMINVQT